LQADKNFQVLAVVLSAIAHLTKHLSYFVNILQLPTER